MQATTAHPLAGDDHRHIGAPPRDAQTRESTPGVGRSSGRGEQLRQGPPADPYSDEANARRRRRLGTFRALKMLSTFSSLERVKKCRRVRVGQGAVEIRHRRDEARAHLAGLQTCGSVWSCPCCSERILAGRADELLRAIATHTATGGDVLMLTLTMRHDRSQALGGLWDALGEAWRSASSSARSVRELLRSVDWVRRVEATHGANGWHVHVHALLFVPAGTDPEPIGEGMFAAWGKRLVGLGLNAPLPGPGMQIKRLDLSNASAEVAEYLAKGHYEEVKPSRPNRNAALELASTGKQARGANRTPMQILADMVANGEACDFELWREWEQASKGRRALTWSRGARDRLVGDVEQTDEELAQSTDQGGEVVAELDPDTWPTIAARPELLNTMLSVVETSHDADDAYLRLEAVLAAEGLPGAVRRPLGVSP
jgi:hypothetical protein